MEPKEHHRKTRLTKNEKMTIALAKVMARSTTDLSDELLERWLELGCYFSAYNSLTPLSTKLQQLLLILILLFYLLIGSRANIQLKSTKAVVVLYTMASASSRRKNSTGTSHLSKSSSPMPVVERAIIFASAIVIFSFLVSLVF